MKPRLAVPMSLALMIAAAITASPSGATFAGRNGRIAFEHITRDAPSQIATVNPSGGHARVLTHFHREATAPAYSPRGGRIAFTVIGTPRIPDKIYTMRAGGAGLKRITSGCTGQCLGDGDPTYSPDGRLIAFNRAYGPIRHDNADHIDLMVMRLNGSDMRVVLQGGVFARRHFEAQRPSWSPDGTQVALTVQDLDSPRLKSAIFTVAVASGGLDRITPWRLNAGNPDYSPNGFRIVFNSHWEGQGHSSLYTMAPDGAALRRLNHPRAHYTFAPAYSPSGNQVVYVVAGRHTTLHLARMSLGGETRKRVTRPQWRGLDPNWGARP
jgi:TolB protein